MSRNEILDLFKNHLLTMTPANGFAVEVTEVGERGQNTTAQGQDDDFPKLRYVFVDVADEDNVEESEDGGLEKDEVKISIVVFFGNEREKMQRQMNITIDETKKCIKRIHGDEGDRVKILNAFPKYPTQDSSAFIVVNCSLLNTQTFY